MTVSDLQLKIESYDKQSDMPIITSESLPDEIKKLIQNDPKLFLLQR